MFLISHPTLLLAVKTNYVETPNHKIMKNEIKCVHSRENYKRKICNSPWLKSRKDMPVLEIKLFLRFSKKSMFDLQVRASREQRRLGGLS